MSYNWNYLFAGYQKTRGGAFFGHIGETNNCQLVLTEGEKYPILVYVDTVPAGRYHNVNIYARTQVQLNETYRLKLGDHSAVVGGVKGLAGMLGGGGGYGYPEVTQNRSIATNNKPFTKQVLGDLDFRNALLKRKKDYVKIEPSPQGDGWHMVEIGDINFEGLLRDSSGWVNDAVAADTLYMAPEDKAAIDKAAQAHFDAEMDEFLSLLRAAARAVTMWRM